MSDEMLIELLRQVGQTNETLAEMKGEQVATQTLIETGVFPRLDRINGDVRMLKTWKVKTETSMAFRDGEATAFVTREQVRRWTIIAAKATPLVAGSGALIELVRRVWL